MFQFRELFNDIPDIHIVDVGASPIDGDPVYKPVLEQGGYRLTCFEPNPSMFEELKKQPTPNMTCFPYAIGDGRDAMLNLCVAPGMNSLIEPYFELLELFHGYTEWGRVVSQIPLSTYRLDDLKQVNAIDFIKLDVQGSELTILENATEQLKHTLVVHVETPFIPRYKNQPLFAEIDLALRKSGFLFHKFDHMVSKIFKPLIRNNDIYAGLSQLHYADAVYVRSFMDFKDLAPSELLKLARILHDMYGSVDLAQLALRHIDLKTGENRQSTYINHLTGGK
ncbi:MAG: FkbM family methyltransferase, partial [Candidatus Nitrotoga sp.]